MWASLIAHARGLARRRAIDAEVEDELRFHLDQEIEAQTARGVPAEEARRIALRDLGGLTQTREAVGDVRAIWFDDARQDVRYACRILRRSPGFAAVAILTLTLGIGGVTAIFSIVNAVLLRPLPYRDPGSLVLVEPTPIGLSPDWAAAAWRARAHTLSDLAGFNGPRATTLVRGGTPEEVHVIDVTGNFLSFLGTPPAIGRSFTDEDTAALTVAILTHDFWTRVFGADPAVLGSTITVAGASLTVIGVTPPAFRFPTAGALPATGIPIDSQPDVIRLARSGLPFNVIGRLAPGVAIAAASTELLGIFRQDGTARFARQMLDRSEVGVVPLQQRLVGDVRQRLWLVMGAVGFILLIACANVANLLLARASTRQRELAVRSALGARTGRLARLLVTESLLLSLIGSFGALLLTFSLRGIARTLLADSVPHVGGIVIDWWVMSFNVAIAVATGILCGLASLPSVSRLNLAAMFSAGNAPAAAGRTRVRRLLLSAEVAMTFVLIVGAALLAQTLWNLNRTTRGFNADRLLTLRVAPERPRPNMANFNATQLYYARFFSDLTVRIRRVPGVAAAAMVSTLPLGGAPMGLTEFSIEGQLVKPAEDEGLATVVASITPGYFETMGTAVASGREFMASDQMSAPLVSIVNEAFRRRWAPARDLVGSRVTYGKRVLTIVGIVADAPDRSLRKEAQPLLFTPLAQMPAGIFGWGELTLVVRAEAREPRSIASLVRREIWSIDSKIVVTELSTMDERVAAALRLERHSALLFGLFAIVALAIAAIGVYGVAAYAMAQRTKEIGIRVALGAGRGDLSRLLISQTLTSTLGGIAFGLALAAAATRMIGARLYGVSALDPATFVGVALLLLLVAFVASYVPARRAMRLDPLVALRAE